MTSVSIERAAQFSPVLLSSFPFLGFLVFYDISRHDRPDLSRKRSPIEDRANDHSRLISTGFIQLTRYIASQVKIQGSRKLGNLSIVSRLLSRFF